MIRARLLLVIVCCVPAVSSGEDVDFNRDVRPILSDACFTCHGPDSGQRQADLRLDQKEGLFRNIDDVSIVDVKHPEHSELLIRILSDDPDLVMPPHDGGRRLTAAEKTIVRQWIAQGAPWQGHWAYIAPKRPEVPNVDVGPSGNDIDRFVQRQLNAKNLQPLPPADGVTLVRRLSLDLTGLPPKPEQVAAFQGASAKERWSRLVEELLQSPAYAERMTALWLDLVRYADTNGIHGDNHREVWMYRDYVIDAFRSNMPFDQFTIEQLAGDLLPNATDKQKIASGYNRLLMTTREGGAQPKEYLAKYSADRVRNASTVWMGATMGCCECHDHKFDPYSIRDFYQFAAFFADIQDVPVGTQPSVKMPSASQKQQLAELDTELAALQNVLDTQTPELDSAFTVWVADHQQKLTTAPPTWLDPTIVDMESTGGQSLKLADDGSLLTSGKHAKRDTYLVSIAVTPGKLTGIKLQALRHDSFVKKSLSRKPGNGNVVLSGVRATLIKQEDEAEQPIALHDPIASFEQRGWPVKNALDGNDATGWAVDGHGKTLRDPVAVFRVQQPLELAEGDRLQIELQHNAIDYHNIGRFRLQTSSFEKPGLNDDTFGIPASLLNVVQSWPGGDDKQKTELQAHFRSNSPLLDEARARKTAATKERDAIQKQVPETLITRIQKPRTIRVLARGDWMDDSGDAVEPSVPHFLPALQSKERASRLHLANWFVDDQNPLVARVFVNRLWKMYFGQGLVKSADDFGSQGAWPTHPDLLDWLAVEFRESGWDVQHIIRLILNSEAYKRSSVATPAAVEADPFNQWLARQSRFRIDAEFVRDGALAMSGLLVDKVGGPSVKPYQPSGYWAHLNFPKRKWEPASGEDQYRRGLYTYWCRTFLHPAMRSFDAPSREECTVDRPRSNNSLQALVLLNDPSFVEAARALAERALNEGGDNEQQRLEFLYRVCLSRLPRPDEQHVLKETLAAYVGEFSADKATAGQLLSVGQSTLPKDIDTVQLAAWTSVARVILNLHETITRS